MTMTTGAPDVVVGEAVVSTDIRIHSVPDPTNPSGQGIQLLLSTI